MRLFQFAALLAATVALSSGAAWAQVPNPTFSIGAVALNDEPIQGAPVSTLTVAPGDTVTAELYVRDWSPGGDELRAYQIQLDEASFTSGLAGSIKPVGYDKSLADKTDNPAGAYIDLNNPQFVHAGLQTIALTDTKNAKGYRWLSVLVDIAQAPVSPEDGTKFYCGTVKLAVSSDAAGTFVIKPVENEQVSGLLKENNRTIGPISYEGLTLTVAPGVVRYRILETDPPNGSIDSRIVGAAGWQTISLTFDADATIDASKFAIADGTPNAPRIADVSTDGPKVTLSLDHAIQTGRWTTLTYLPSGFTVRLGALPGDVDGNEVCDSRDAVAMLEALQAGDATQTGSADINGDGVLNARDGLCLIDLLVKNLTRRLSRS